MTQSEAHSFGQLLRELRQAAGLSREALAERAGLSLKAIGALERGDRTTPRNATIELLAVALKVGPIERAGLIAAARSGNRSPPRVVAPLMPIRPGVPIPPSSMIGREADVARTSLLLDPRAADVRLVTLVGTGGVGKTRLALELAAQVGRRYREGAVFVDLAPLHDQRLVAATIARALEVRETAGRSAQELLRLHLAQRQLLLVLDNFEHLLGAAPLVAELLASCPALKLLVTSRSALRLRGERRVAVASLGGPDPSQPLAAIAAAPAVQLFVERAQAIAPEFVLTEANAGDVARICGHLDGLPLALELAAARMTLLQPGALARRLDRRLASLTNGAPDLPERQRTLRNALAWSYDLLDSAEQALFRRLAVFAGSFTLAAAETVCGPATRASGPDDLTADTVWDRLGALVDHSLVRGLEVAEADAEPRFGLLQTIHEYAAEQLEANAETDTLRSRHRDWYLALLERTQAQLATPEQLTTLDRDQDNYRAALRWTSDRGDAHAGLRFGVACWRLWYWRGRYTEGRAWFDELLALAGGEDHPVLRAQALAYAGHLAYCQGDRARSRLYLDEALSLAQTAGDHAGIERCSVFLGHLLRQGGDLAEAERQYTLALSLSRPEDGHNIRAAALRGLARTRYERGDPAGAGAALAAAAQRPVRRDHPKRHARVAALSGRLAALEGDDEVGWSLLKQSLAALEQSGDRQGQVFAHQLAADTALDHGHGSRAAHHLEQLLHIARECGEQAGLARALEAVAELLAPDESVRALELVGTASALREGLGIQMTPRERDRLDRWVPAASNLLGDPAVGAALALGRARMLETVLDDALFTCLKRTAEPSDGRRPKVRKSSAYS